MTPEKAFISAYKKIKPDAHIVVAPNIQAREEGWDMSIDGLKYLVVRMHRDVCTIETVDYLNQPGWLYKKADYLSFEIDKGFLLVDRDQMIRLVESKSPDVQVQVSKDDVKDIVTKIVYK